MKKELKKLLKTFWHFLHISMILTVMQMGYQLFHTENMINRVIITLLMFEIERYFYNRYTK